MKVAVPSAQQSDRLGQPASSHTVTRPSSRTVRFSASTSGPWCTLGRSQSGLRVEICSPPTTPACASRPCRCCDASPHHRARALAPREGRQVVRAVPPGHVLALDIAPPPQASAALAETTSTTCPHRDVKALGLQRGDRLAHDAARDDVAEHREVGRDVEGEAVHGAAPAQPDADGRHLPRVVAVGVEPHAGIVAQAAGAGQAEVGEGVDEHLLDGAHVGHGVGQAAARPALGRQGQDRDSRRAARGRGR